MNAAVFLIAAALALMLDAALMPALALWGASPSLVGCLAAFIALHADRRAAWWGCWALGLLLDLSTPMPVGGAATIVPGPHALGFTFGAALVLTARAEVMRRNVLANAVTTFAVLLSASLVWTALWMVRGWWPDGEWVWTESAIQELGRRAWWSAVSAGMAVPVSWVLARTWSWWSFPVSWRMR